MTSLAACWTSEPRVQLFWKREHGVSEDSRADDGRQPVSDLPSLDSFVRRGHILRNLFPAIQKVLAAAS